MLVKQRDVGFLGSWARLIVEWIIGGAITHNRPAKSSKELITANEIAIVAQILENDIFFQTEFGISAGLFHLT